jgi:hypothetical protein
MSKIDKEQKSPSVVTFTDDQGRLAEFEVLDTAKLCGVNYLMVVEKENLASDGDGLEDNEEDEEDNEEEDELPVYILKEIKSDSESDVLYDMVSDEKEAETLFNVFLKQQQEI